MIFPARSSPFINKTLIFQPHYTIRLSILSYWGWYFCAESTSQYSGPFVEFDWYGEVLMVGERGLLQPVVATKQKLIGHDCTPQAAQI
jgi:hypothetical protein